MTQDGVRSGGSPRAPRPGDHQEPDTAPPVVQPPPADWLAPVAPPDDWLAPAAPAAPAASLAPVAPAGPPPVAPPIADQPLADEALEDDAFADEPLEGDEPEEAEPPRLPLSERLKRTPPALVFLTLAAIGSTGFLAFELSTRTAPIAVLSSASVVVGICYVAITIVCAIATYRAGSDGRTRLAFLLAFIGGSAAIVAAMSFAGALVLVLALGF
ncbi:MAG: hypothetical protein ABSD62_14985 [Candidatus Limnocylindrales bacterium]|jgi:hypothetical protein